jgi:NADPH2:quinone reductase
LSAHGTTGDEGRHMRAVLMTAVGRPEVLQVAELPEPQITGERDVKVRLRAAGLNPVDYKLRSYGTISGSLPGRP